jgi:hypothetical protein
LAEFLLHKLSNTSNQLLLLNSLDDHHLLEWRKSVIELRWQWHVGWLF